MKEIDFDLVYAAEARDYSIELCIIRVYADGTLGWILTFFWSSELAPIAEIVHPTTETINAWMEACGEGVHPMDPVDLKDIRTYYLSEERIAQRLAALEEERLKLEKLRAILRR